MFYVHFLKNIFTLSMFYYTKIWDHRQNNKNIILILVQSLFRTESKKLKFNRGFLVLIDNYGNHTNTRNYFSSYILLISLNYYIN